MGALEFIRYSDGSDVEQVFRTVVDESVRCYGDNGETGTIADKDSYVVIDDTPHSVDDAIARAQELLSSYDERISDKRGPAGAIAVGPINRVSGWLFFGLAPY